MKRTAALSPAYRRFISDRDLALEKILHAFQFRIADALGTALARIEDFAFSAVSKMRDNYFSHQSKEVENNFEQKVSQSLISIAPHISLEIQKMNRICYLLSYGAELEAIGQATDTDVLGKNGDPVSGIMTGAPVQARVELALYKLKSNIMMAFKRARIQELTTEDFIIAVTGAFPKRKQIPERRHVLRQPKLKEAAQEPKTPFGFDTISQEDWDQIVSEYLASEVPTYPYRTPEVMPDKFYIPSKNREVYAWEIEQEATQSFVDQVRSGSSDAGRDAKDAGVTGFVWIAVIDDKTDDCCAKRDGLTDQEIQEKLYGAWSDDDCDAIVPPAHFNCATAGHKILTNDGQKLIEDIKPGMKVWTHLDRFREVTRVLQRRASNLIKITLEDGRMITVTEEHPFMVNGEWIEAGCLTEGTSLIEVCLDLKSGISYKGSRGSKSHGAELLSKGSYD